MDVQARLEAFGFDTRTAQHLARVSQEHGLTDTDVEAWITEAQASTSIKNPRGFVRARIQAGDKPAPQPAPRAYHDDRRRYIPSIACQQCAAAPCLCDWDPQKEDLQAFLIRTNVRVP